MCSRRPKGRALAVMSWGALEPAAAVGPDDSVGVAADVMGVDAALGY